MMLEKENNVNDNLYYWDDELPEKEYNDEYDDDLYLDEDYYEGWD